MHRAEKRYLEAREWIDSLNQNNIVPGLERIERIMNALENPEKKLDLIIIGGTNAKGSTCFNLSYNLAQNGIKTGCFSSPHIHSIRERIRINNDMISKIEFTDLINTIKEITVREKIKATYFEIITAAAYQYFHTNNVDYAIMEVGLGGEWDAVNIGDAKIAILTTLGIDHIDYLGSDIKGIAKTKAKIVRKNSDVITGWPEIYHKLIPKSKSLSYYKTVREWIQHTLKILNINEEVVMTKIPGRYEKYANFIIDTAHNPQAMKYLISKNNDYGKIIIGMMKDKDIESIVKYLPKECEILVTNLKTERSAKKSDLALVCNNLGYNYKEFDNVELAIEYAKNDKTLITGSFYTVSEARKYFELEGHSEL